MPDGAFDIRLGSTHVGYLHLEGDRSEFALDPEYLSLAQRPILGQVFEDDLERRHTARMRLPPFFANLLPEGRLRALIAAQHGLRDMRDAQLLSLLGGDLPGAVTAGLVGELTAIEAEETEPTPHQAAAGALRFSLAGMQLKFSMLREGKGLTLPHTGRGGDWLVKLPDNRFDAVPENEFAMLTWARQAGLRVPDFFQVPISELTGLPDEASGLRGTALAIARFDRGPEGRVHFEDFAQIRNVYGDQDNKYRHASYESMGRTIRNLAGEAGLEEFVGRLVFMVASGNEDAHLKNWAIRYPDGRRAELAPAYDLVATIAYDLLGGGPRGLALNLARSKEFGKVTRQSFERFARKVKADERWVLSIVDRSVARVRAAWLELSRELPLSESVRERISSHLASVPILAG